MFLIERKWYAVFFWDKETFIEEFIERDLFHATELRQIRWSFLGNKPTKTQIGDMLNEGRDELRRLGSNKAMQLFPHDELMDANNFVDRIIFNFNNDTIFNQIFK